MELARDLVMKSKQIETLIASLPAIGSSEGEQQGRLRRLEMELKEAEAERVRSAHELEVAEGKLAVIKGLGGV